MFVILIQSKDECKSPMINKYGHQWECKVKIIVMENIHHLAVKQDQK